MPSPSDKPIYTIEFLKGKCHAWERGVGRCPKPAKTRGFCDRHYRQLLRGTSDPNVRVRRWIEPYLRSDGKGGQVLIEGYWQTVRAGLTGQAQWERWRPSLVDKGPCANARDPKVKCKERAKWKGLCGRCYARHQARRPEVKAKRKAYEEKIKERRREYNRAAFQRRAEKKRGAA